jgi:hypothetical protein
LVQCLFDHAVTIGGKDKLIEMFSYPLTGCEQIEQMIDAMKFPCNSDLAFLTNLLPLTSNSLFPRYKIIHHRLPDQCRRQDALRQDKIMKALLVKFIAQSLFGIFPEGDKFCKTIKITVGLAGRP